MIAMIKHAARTQLQQNRFWIQCAVLCADMNSPLFDPVSLWRKTLRLSNVSCGPIDLHVGIGLIGLQDHLLIAQGKRALFSETTFHPNDPTVSANTNVNDLPNSCPKTTFQDVCVVIRRHKWFEVRVSFHEFDATA